MKRYVTAENTPLKYHSVLWYFILPAAFLTGCAILFSYFFYISMSPFAIYDLLVLVVEMGLCAACFVGFFQWKRYSLYCVNLACVVATLYELSLLLLYIFCAQLLFLPALGGFLGMLVLSVLNFIYYHKRKALFVGAGRGTGQPKTADPAAEASPNRSEAQEAAPAPAQPISPAPQPQNEETADADQREKAGPDVPPAVHVCPICGRQLPPGATICQFCGTKWGAPL